MKLNRNKMLAEDMTQNVFEKLLKYRGSYREEKNFRSWIYTIARNVNIDRHRKRTEESLSEQAKESVYHGISAQESMEKKEQHQILLDALNQLQQDEKELVVLTKIERMKFSEVSKIMGITENALKVKSHRCIKKLRAILVNDIRYEY